MHAASSKLWQICLTMPRNTPMPSARYKSGLSLARQILLSLSPIKGGASRPNSLNEYLTGSIRLSTAAIRVVTASGLVLQFVADWSKHTEEASGSKANTASD